VSTWAVGERRGRGNSRDVVPLPRDWAPQSRADGDVAGRVDHDRGMIVRPTEGSHLSCAEEGLRLAARLRVVSQDRCILRPWAVTIGVMLLLTSAHATVIPTLTLEGMLGIAPLATTLARTLQFNARHLSLSLAKAPLSDRTKLPHELMVIESVDATVLPKFTMT
jgi:hypothetical protein